LFSAFERFCQMGILNLNPPAMLFLGFSASPHLAALAAVDNFLFFVQKCKIPLAATITSD
jgi:hypothetical protein